MKKQVAIIEVRGDQYRMLPVPLRLESLHDDYNLTMSRTVRPFKMRDVKLANELVAGEHKLESIVEVPTDLQYRSYYLFLGPFKTAS